MAESMLYFELVYLGFIPPTALLLLDAAILVVAALLGSAERIVRSSIVH